MQKNMALRFRPKSFSEVVGQDPAVKVMKKLVEKPDLRVIMLSGQHGIGKCVAGSTRCLTQEGWIAIESKKTSDVPNSASPLSIKVEAFPNKAVAEALYYRGEEVGLQLELSDGSGLTALDVHPVLTYTRAGFEWRQMSSLTPVHGLFVPTTGRSPSEIQEHKFVTDGPYYFMGLASRGYFSKGEFCLEGPGKHFLKLIEELDIGDASIKKLSDKRGLFKSRKLADSMQAVGVNVCEKDCTQFEGGLETILEGSLDQHWSFLSGYWDGCQTNYKQIRGYGLHRMKLIRLLLLSLGIHSTLYKSPGYSGWQLSIDQYSLWTSGVSFGELNPMNLPAELELLIDFSDSVVPHSVHLDPILKKIGLSSSTVSKRILHLAASRYADILTPEDIGIVTAYLRLQFNTIKSLSSRMVKESFYDFVVPGAENFVTEGIVSHNTTLARLYAKAINCQSIAHGDACGTCDSCKATDMGRQSDYSERDMGSSGLVEHIRKLQDEVNFKPAWHYRVFTLDEVHCADAHSTMLVDGHSVDYGRVVSKQMNGEVECIDLNSMEVKKSKISNWFKNGKAHSWIKLDWDGGSGIYTPRHSFMVGREFKFLEELGSEFYADFVGWELGYVQDQILLGTLLGDSIIVKPKLRGSFETSLVQFMASTKYSEFLKWKVSFFEPLVKLSNDKREDLLRYYTLKDECFNSYYDMLKFKRGEQKGYKHVSKEWLNRMGPLAWAVWLMDDGHTDKNGVVTFSCTNLSSRGAQVVINHLAEMGFEVRLTVSKETRTVLKKSAVRFYFTVESSKRFLAMVAPYVHDQFRYKVFGFETKVEIEASKLKRVVFEKSKKVVCRSLFSSRGRQRFAVEIENQHNYVLPGGLVSKNSISKEAGNALLKTLEEPPARACFVLCTTEPRRVPYPIASRCLLLELEPIKRELVADRLVKACKLERINIDPQAALAIAKATHGSLRDAFMVVERVSILSDGNITLASLQDEHWYINSKQVVDLIKALLVRDYQAFIHIQDALTGRNSFISMIQAALDRICDSAVNKKETSEKTAVLVDALWLSYVRLMRQADPIVVMKGLWTETQRNLKLNLQKV